MCQTVEEEFTGMNNLQPCLRELVGLDVVHDGLTYFIINV